jgi:pilus assembly protein Flp/PilA
MNKMIQRFIRDEAGQDIIEYALLAAFISVIAILAVTTIGTKVNTIYEGVSGQLS